MKFSINKSLVTFLCIFCFIISSCDLLDDEDLTYSETPKSVVGTWKIIKATRNDVDVTDYMDFSEFRISFTSDGKYTIENYLPFIVINNGTWNLDDPLYPFQILFDEENDDSLEEVITDFSFPIVEGKRQIEMTFSPGCYRNSYTYTLEKDSN